MEKEMKNKEKVMASTSAQHHVTENHEQVGPYANIPDDLVVEILKLLPAKSILRFKIVCKQWLSTIQDPAFISSYNKLAHMRSDGGGGVLVFARTQAEHAPRFFSAPYEGGVASSLLHPNLTEKLNRYNASQPTQGLVLLFPECQHYEAEDKVYVFNPTTRELVSLPPLDLNQEHELQKIAKENWWSPITVNYYLGYDPSTEIYKVLSICSINSGEGRYVSKNFYYLLTLGANEYWRKHDSPHYLQSTREKLDSHYCCVNGSIYLIATPISVGNYFLVAFDIGKEKFRLVQPPQYWPSNKLRQLGNHLTVCVYKGLLILEDRIWTFMRLPEIIKWKHSYDIVGGTQLKNKYCLMIVNEDVEQDDDEDEDEEETEAVLSVGYCDKRGLKWSEFKITCLPDKALFGFQTSNNIETLFSPSVCLR